MTLACPECGDPYRYLNKCTDRCEACDRCFMCCVCPDTRTEEQKATTERARLRALAQCGILSSLAIAEKALEAE